MRRPNLFRSRENDLDSMMTPMIDVVFLLLIFFVWTTSVQVVEYILPSQISAQIGNQPSETTPPPEEDFDEVVVKIGWDGESPIWRINDVRLASLEQVKDRLRQIAQVKSDAPIILHPEALVPMGYVIDGFDAAKWSGFQQISFAVDAEGQSG